MQLRNVRIQNIKLLRNFSLDFLSTAGTSRQWTVLIGENGLCKTTVLQAIAMAASGFVRANQLADVPSLSDRRAPNAEAEIIAEFGFSAERHAFRAYPGLLPLQKLPPRLVSRLTLAPGSAEVDGETFFQDAAGLRLKNGDPLREVRAKNLSLWFVAGYGTSRLLPRPMESERSKDPALDRLNPLFDKGRLVGTGFADLLEAPQDYAIAVRQALVDSGLLPNVKGLELRGRGGVRSAHDLVEGHRFAIRVGNDQVKVPATWLSQGYQGTIAWIADLIGQVFLEAEGPVPLEAMEGIVLVDEIDLHLHPKWQVDLIPTLKRVFRSMQFVVTTHSPMVLPGLERDEVFIMRQQPDGNVTADPAPDAPALLTGSEIYETFFGITKLYPNELGEKLRRYGFLVGNAGRTGLEDVEMARLQSDLHAHGVDPGWTPTPRLTELPSFEDDGESS